jgi:DNA-directed RNA polymerase specialized sigma subunit
MSAEGDLKNRIARERKHPKTVSLEAVAFARDQGNTPLAERIADPTVDPDRWVEETDPVLLETIREELPNEADRRVLALMARGERSTPTFAEALGISHLSPREQRRRVKQAKDRILQRLKRALRRREWRHGP